MRNRVRTIPRMNLLILHWPVSVQWTTGRSSCIPSRPLDSDVHPSNWVDEGHILKLEIEVGDRHFGFSKYPFIPYSFLFHYGMDVCVSEGLTSGGLVPLVIQPICDLLVIQTFLLQIRDFTVECMLFVGVRCDPQIWRSKIEIKSKVN